MQEFDSGQIRTRTRLMKILQTQLTKRKKKNLVEKWLILYYIQ